MKNASQWALFSGAAVLGIAYACATPEDIHGCQPGTNDTNCDVIIAQASDFGSPDASAEGAQAGSDGISPSGSAGSSNAPAGAAGTNSPASGGSAGQGAAGSGSAGAGGASGGTAGSSAGTGGTAGTSGAAGTMGAAGAGGTTAQSNFNPSACNFANRAGCEAQACATACPTNMGTYCSDNCQAIITCVSAAPACITAQDPMCGTPSQNPYTVNTCTSQVNNSGNPATAGTPASIALALMNCLCDDTRL